MSLAKTVKLRVLVHAFFRLLLARDHARCSAIRVSRSVEKRCWRYSSADCPLLRGTRDAS
eukprot:12431434-Karenia_brevis.AAC.1